MAKTPGRSAVTIQVTKTPPATSPWVPTTPSAPRGPTLLTLAIIL